MMHQAAFTTHRKLLKGGLHCHTTRSDGSGTPEEVIRHHKQHGFDFLALTDHRNYNYLNFAPETGITIIPGMEMDAALPEKGVHCFHSVCIGPAREDGNGFIQDEKLDSGLVRDQYEYQAILDRIHAKNNLTIYCHPEWSGTPAREFENLKGNIGLEIWNSGCALVDELDTNAAYWDELLMRGKRVLGFAVDDGHAMYQHCNGWVMVNAGNSINSILESLKAGAFYSSCGPQIYDFRIEDGNAIVDCSPSRYIAFRWGGFPTRIKRDESRLITHAEFKVPDYYTYLRVFVMDEGGHRAWTNPIYFD